MSDELREIEIETARIKLERERMALDDELRKRQRVESAKEATTNAVEELKPMAVGFVKLALKLGLWFIVAYIVFAVIAIVFRLPIS